MPYYPSMKKYRLCDLFSGIGGVRLGFHQTGRFESVFNCEIDNSACDTFQANFGENPKGDIRKVDPGVLPEFDVLAAGFPCQAFSAAGKKKGFEDARGTLFFEVARLLDARKPPAVFLENVKGLVNHDGGRTLQVILKILQDLGYDVAWRVLNARNYGVPQNRERIYIVGLRFDIPGSLGFQFPEATDGTKRLSDVLSKEPVPSKYFLSQTYLDGLKRHRANQEAKGYGFGYKVRKATDVANAILVGGMGRERNLVRDDRLPAGESGFRNDDGIRKLTPRECARLQGFPEAFAMAENDAAAYKQFGNSVAVPVVQAIANRIAAALDSFGQA